MNLALLAVIIGALSLDTTIAFQMLISSPIFTCPLLGWILGDVTLGFELGFLLQLLWLSRIPAGAVAFPEGNIASMVIAALVLLNKENGFPNTNLSVIFLEGILISYLGARITLLYRQLNGKMLNFVNKEVEEAHFKRIVLLEIGSVVFYFFIMFTFTYLTLFISQLYLPKVLNSIGSLFEDQLIIIKPAILGLGMGFILLLLREVFRKKVKK